MAIQIPEMGRSVTAVWKENSILLHNLRKARSTIEGELRCVCVCVCVCVGVCVCVCVGVYLYG